MLIKKGGMPKELVLQPSPFLFPCVHFILTASVAILFPRVQSHFSLPAKAQWSWLASHTADYHNNEQLRDAAEAEHGCQRPWVDP
jgi:hypothetical protein